MTRIGYLKDADTLYRKALRAHTPANLHNRINESTVWELGRKIMATSYHHTDVSFTDNTGIAITLPTESYVHDASLLSNLIDLTEEILRPAIAYRICGSMT